MTNHQKAQCATPTQPLAFQFNQEANQLQNHRDFRAHCPHGYDHLDRRYECTDDVLVDQVLQAVHVVGWISCPDT